MKPGADNSEQFILPNFQNPFWRDHNNIQGYGRLLWWVSNKIACTRRKDIEHPDIELLWFALALSMKELYLCTVYRPPNRNLDFGDALQENIELFQQQCDGKILLIGEFNADPITVNGTYLTNFCNVNRLLKHIDQATRITAKSSTILDQCQKNLPVLIKKVENLPAIYCCDIL